MTETGFTTRTFTFDNQGTALSGSLYLPADHDGTPLPGVVITGAWTSVQGQMPARYAAELAKRGFAAVTFDFRGWGASGDLPGGQRYVEHPGEKTSDIQAAITATAALAEVDAGRVHGLGICASAGYMVDAVAGNPAIRALGLVAPWLQTREIVETVYGGAEGVAGLIAMGQAAEAAGGQIIPAAGPEGADGVLMPIGGYYYEANRGAIPSYDNKWNIASWPHWLRYYPAEDAGRLDKPLALLHSDAAAIPEGARLFAATATVPVQETWLDGVIQFDFYDQDGPVAAAADAMAAHFAQ